MSNFGAPQAAAVLTGDTPTDVELETPAAVGAGTTASRSNHVHGGDYPQSVNSALYTIIAGADGWVDVDISATVPGGASLVEGVLQHNGGQQSLVVGARQNGEANPPSISIGNVGAESGAAGVTAVLRLDANRVIECYRNATANAYFRVMRYWRSS